MSLNVRLTEAEDGPFLKTWLSDAYVLRFFPMFDEREIDDAVRIWIHYSKIEAGLTIESDGTPCGMANLYIQPFKKLAHQCLFSIIVADGYRGKGVGRVLIEALKKHAKEKFQIEILHLEVYAGNPAIHLYRKTGFREFGCQNQFIKDKGEYIGKIFMQQEL